MNVTDHAWEPGGPDQLQVEVPAVEAHGLLKNEQFQRAARLLNLRLMRKNTTPSGKFHCFALADRVIP